jgi:tetratricopeptide (TPR) repeat protein
MMRAAWLPLALGLIAAPASGQAGRGGDPESRLQLEAATLESRGDLAGAEASYRRLLEIDPLAAGTVFALERVLRAQGQIAELRPIVVAFLARSANPDVMGLNFRLLTEVDSTSAMVADAEGWLAGSRNEAAYRAVARAYAEALGPDRALDVLRRGRAAIGAPDALALDMGDLLLERGNVDGAVDEWALAVGDGARIDEVVGRVAALGEGAPSAGRRLANALADSDVAERRDAALTAALALGLESEALALARRSVDGRDGRTRVVYLEDVARRARVARAARVAAWAFQELGGATVNPEERRQFERRTVEVALEAGDTVTALEAQRRLAASVSRSSDEGRRAQAEVIRLEATVTPESAPASWREFRAAFPDAPELDEVAAAVAVSLQMRGNAEGAADVLDGVEGPRSTLERGYLLLGQGQVESGRQALLLAVSGLPAVEATTIIQFSSLLGRLSDGGAEALVAAGVEEHRGRPLEAARGLEGATATLPENDRAPVLAEAARMADRAGSPERAAAMRERIIEEYPNTPEFAEASLALARHMARPGGDDRAAIRLLEELIVSRPNAAVVPEARLELERLRSRGS